MSSSIAIPAGPSATRPFHKGTGSSTNSPFGTPSSSPPSAGKDKALHNRRPSLLKIFLPSYIDCDYVPLENRRDPVHEIILTDDESKNLLPH
ncbi:hypothetical protein LB505_005949 [Fusarium chuoi]|nr:hypothetical protein LB505_005949 [Fusarium chuoi]